MTNQTNLDADRFAAFSAAYLAGLTKAVETHPEDYFDVVTVKGFVDVVHPKMMAAIQTGSYNHNSRGFKNACKTLGIKHTRTAIAAFLKGA